MFAGTRFFAAKRALLRVSGIAIGDDVKVVAPLHIGGVAALALGKGVWVGRNFSVEGNGAVSIGNNVDIGPNVTIGTGGHEIGPPSRRAGKGIVARVEIGDGSWVGQNSLIIGDCVIGSGCLVAAGAVVVDDVPDNVMVAGVPAKVKKALPAERRVND